MSWRLDCGERDHDVLSIGTHTTGLAGRIHPLEIAAFNFVVGPTVHPPKHPRDVLVGMLATFTDFTDANNRNLTRKDIFSVQLFLAMPINTP